MKIISFWKRTISLAVFAVLLLALSDAQAQKVTALTMSTFTAPYQSISNDPNATQLLCCGSDDDIIQITLPFDFKYDGVQYSAGSTLSITSDGSLVFGADFDDVNDPNRWNVLYNIDNVIMPFNTDLVLFSETNGALYEEVTGVSPNQVVTFEWQNFGIFYNPNNVTSMEIKLYETSNVIEFWYQDPGYQFDGSILPATGDPAAGIVGLNGSPASSDFNYYDGSASFIPKNNIRYQYIPPPNIQLSVQPKVLDFGQVNAGSSDTLATKVINAGTNGTLIITGAAVSGSANFKIVSSPATNTYNIGDSAGTYGVVFSPITSGISQGYLTISSNGLDSGVQQVVLLGIGVVADIAVDTTTLFQRTKTKLGDTLISWIHISSTGQGILKIASLPITGIDAGEYFIFHYPATSIPPGMTDSIGIYYIPTMEGKHTATLTINSNAVNFPSVQVSLQGTGILPRILVTPPGPLLFDSTATGDTVCKNISITNTGSDTLRIKANFLISGEGDFSYTGLTGKDTAIAPEQTKIVTICFHPLQAGTREARLLLRTNIPLTFETPRRDTGSSYIVEIRGTGVPLGVFSQRISGPPTLDSVIVGKTVCRTDSLCNTGDADILVTSMTINGPTPSTFTTTGFPVVPFTLKARSCITFSVCGTPATAGLLIGSATIVGTTNGRTKTLIEPLGVFGLNVCVSAPITLFSTTVLPNNGTDSILCFEVTNCGDIPDKYTFAISGDSAANYSIVSETPGGLIAPTASDTICLKYKPVAVGASPAVLNITPMNAAKASIVLGGSAGCAILTDLVDNIPNTGTFETSTFNVTITNNGTFAWTPGAATITQTGTKFGLPAGVTTTNPATIAPNGGTAVQQVTFSPGKDIGGPFTAQLTYPNSTPCGTLASVNLSAQSIKGSVAETTSEGFSLGQAYPNPTQGKTSFTYTTPHECQITITLVDMTGRVIETLVSGNVSGGEYTVAFDASKYSSGTYLYVLESGSTRLVRQINLTK